MDIDNEKNNDGAHEVNECGEGEDATPEKAEERTDKTDNQSKGPQETF